MIEQDDILKHYRYQKRRKSKNVSKSKSGSGVTGGAGGVQLAGTVALKKIDDAIVRRKLRKLGREAIANKHKNFKEYTKAMVSKGDAAMRAEKVKRAISLIDVERHLKSLAESKKANDRSRQQHGEVKVRSYRRNGKIVRGYKRARRSSGGGTR